MYCYCNYTVDKRAKSFLVVRRFRITMGKKGLLKQLHSIQIWERTSNMQDVKWSQITKWFVERFCCTQVVVLPMYEWFQVITNLKFGFCYFRRSSLLYYNEMSTFFYKGGFRKYLHRHLTSLLFSKVRIFKQNFIANEYFFQEKYFFFQFFSIHFIFAGAIKIFLCFARGMVLSTL